MSPTAQLACPRCARPHAEHSRACELCGQLLRTPATAAVTAPAAPAPAATVLARPAPAARALPFAAAPDRSPWIYLALGLATAPLFAATPLVRFMGWFLASLVHEMGHAAYAWLCGMPAVPAISLEGHAAAAHMKQQPLLVLLIGGGAAAWMGTKLAGTRRWVALGALAVLYPLLALTGVRELGFLLAGHGAELGFGVLCLWKTLDGGFTESRLERALYGTVGWYLVGRNAWLCLGLMGSAAARDEYHSSGSFGLPNDYIRAAEDVLGWQLQSVALLMLIGAILVLPVALALWRATLRWRAAGAQQAARA